MSNRTGRKGLIFFGGYIKSTLFILACLAFVVGACGKKGGGNGGTANTVSYYQSDSACYIVSSNKEVEISKCSGIAYYMEYGYCYKKSNDDEVDMDNCTKSLGAFYFSYGSCTEKSSGDSVENELCTAEHVYGYDSDYTCIDKKTGKKAPESECEDDQYGGGGEHACYGDFVKIDQYGFGTVVTCNGSNCAGKQLWNPYMGLWVNCQ
jgi:hypothetical protein